MSKQRDLIHKWANERLIVIDKPGASLDTAGDWYRDFQMWGAGNIEVMQIATNMFGRHIRNFDGIAVRRRAHGAVMLGAAIRTGQDGVPFVAKVKAIGPRLTAADKAGKALRATPLEIALGALDVIRSMTDAKNAPLVAAEAMAAISDMRTRKGVDAKKV